MTRRKESVYFVLLVIVGFIAAFQYGDKHALERALKAASPSKDESQLRTARDNASMGRSRAAVDAPEAERDYYRDTVTGG